jgi:hypothetical protein
MVFSVTLALAMSTTSGWFTLPYSGPRILPPGPGYGWGFPNGNPDGYGWFDHGVYLPLGADRTAEYYFPRYWCAPASQMFFPTYENPYQSRGQRYLAFAGCAPGFHPAGGLPTSPSDMPEHPYLDTIGAGLAIPAPNFGGRVEAPPITSGGTGLTP